MLRQISKKIAIITGVLALMLVPALQTGVAHASTPMECSGGTCTFWKDAPIYAGNGQYVGYLHAGSNWVVCQQWGKTVHEGQWYNSWWAWTLRDKGTGSYGDGWGWVNAVYVKGGDNNQAYPGVANCNGAHGAAPAEASAPAPTPAPSQTPSRPPQSAQPAVRTPAVSTQASSSPIPATSTPEGPQGHLNKPRVDAAGSPEDPSDCHLGDKIVHVGGRMYCVDPSLRRAASNDLKNDYYNVI